MYTEMKDKKIYLAILFHKRTGEETARFHKGSIPRWIKTGRIYDGVDFKTFQKRTSQNGWEDVGQVICWNDGLNNNEFCVHICV